MQLLSSADAVAPVAPLTKRSRVIRPTAHGCALVGACGYVVAFALRLPYDVPLLALVACGVVAVARAPWSHPVPRALAVAMAAFAVSFVLSLTVSASPSRSLQLSEPLLPGVLLFAIVAGFFEGPADTRCLFAALSALALGLGGAVILGAWRRPELDATALVASLGTPALVVPNDVTLLAIVAPLAVALLRSRVPGATAVLAAASLLATVIAVAILESRLAALIMIGGVAGAVGTASRRRVALAAAAIGGVVVLVDAARGFPLLQKFGGAPNPRIALWLSALAMFRDAPWLGQGPHAFGLLQGSYVSALALPNWIPVDDRAVPWAHDLYLEVLAEQGVVGLAALVAVLAVTVGLARRVARASASAEERLLGSGAYVAVLALCAAAAAELTLMREWVAVVTLALVGLVSNSTARLARTPGGD